MANKSVAKKKVLVALSGGVDSSVAATLLIEKGFEVEAAYMRCWSEGPYCSTTKDQADAGRVAATLDIPLHIFDFEKEYKEKVINYFFAEYKAGRTPNPDVMCNKEIKFGLFLKKARRLGFDYIATGHYARVKRYHVSGLLAARLSDGQGKAGIKYQDTKGNGRSVTEKGKDQSLEYKLLAGVDREKDQSYFLYQIGQEQLSMALFPLGKMEKSTVRAFAKKRGLPTAEKPDSMGICFVGPADVRELLLQKIKPAHGDIVNPKGKVIGRHIGLPFYTIGQREGLNISASVPYYLARKEEKTNTLVAAPIGSDELFKDKFTGSDIHWTSGKEPMFPLNLQVKLRYRAENVRATIDKIDKDHLSVQLKSAQRAITPGQSAVFYRSLRALRPDGLRDLRSQRSRDLKGSEVVGGVVIN